MQRCLDNGDLAQKEQLVKKIVEHLKRLVQDQFGNYVIQYILEMEDYFFEYKRKVAEALLPWVTSPIPFRITTAKKPT